MSIQQIEEAIKGLSRAEIEELRAWIEDYLEDEREAAGALPFVMEGWTPMEGGAPYAGLLTRMGYQVRACTCSDAASGIASEAPYVALPTPQPAETESANN